MNFKKNIPIKHLNTFNINVKCKLFCQIKSKNDIHQLILSKEFQNHKTLILGGGSNLLFTKNFDGLIIKNEIFGKKTILESKTTKIIKVGAGENWHKFVMWSIKKGLSGAENMALIPGEVGAVPIQNIGAYGAEVKEIIEDVFAVNMENGKEIILSNKECDFQYRDSIFKNKYHGKLMITHVSFSLNKIPQYNIKYGDLEKEIKKLGENISTQNIFQAVINIRNRKLPDPRKIGNSGSFFKNPIISKIEFKKIKKSFPQIIGYSVSENEMKVAAGWLIEECGWKGYRKNDAGVHKDQALVLVNHGDATGKEILHLSEKIQSSVKNKFNIKLTPEVTIIK